MNDTRPICACAIPAHAVGPRHAFCLQGYEYPGLSYCPFDTYEQCLASASGLRRYCDTNPFYMSYAPPEPRRHRRHHRHHHHRS